MSLFAELNGNRARSVTLVMPYQGIWYADVYLDQSVSLSGIATLKIGGLSLKGSFFRSGAFVGASAFRLAGGFGGWSNIIPAKPYRSLFGVRFSLLALDAARECGELVVVPFDFTVGESYMRQNGPASRLLNTLATQWWIDTNGITHTEPRLTPTVSSQFDTIPDGTDLAAGKVRVATDKPEDWQPGCFFSSPVLPTMQISGVVHKLDRDKLRTDVWTL